MNCHKVNDTVAQGVFGPDLHQAYDPPNHRRRRSPARRQNLWAWSRDPQDLKVGCLMPDMQLLDKEVDDVVAYLKTLK